MTTIGEWNAADNRMTYSIYNEDDLQESYACSEHGVKEWITAWDAIRLDLDAGEIPDGTHRVMSDWFTREQNLIGRSNPGTPVWYTGIKVKDGKFVPETLSEPCYAASCAVYGVDPEVPGVNIDHIFIEYLRWDERRRCIILTTGS